MTTRLGEIDLHLVGEGRHEQLYEKLGAHVTDEGVTFAVWAPNATKVSVVGEWNGWDGSVNPMESARRLRHLGDGRRGGARGRALPLRDHDARRTRATQVRPVRLRG